VERTLRKANNSAFKTALTMTMARASKRSISHPATTPPMPPPTK